jgi:hypothetical protein
MCLVVKIAARCAACGVAAFVAAPAADAQSPWTSTLALGYARGVSNLGGPGSITMSLDVFRGISDDLDLGFSAGLHRLGTESYVIDYGPDLLPPDDEEIDPIWASAAREQGDFGRDVFQASAALRFHPSSARGPYPYATLATGLYVYRTSDVIHYWDANGVPIPEMEGRQTLFSTYWGLSAEVGVARLGTVGPFGISLAGRWHAFGLGEFAHMISFALGLTIPS